MIYIVSEKTIDIRDKNSFTYSYRMWYQYSNKDVYVIDPYTINIPTGVNVFGFKADILKKDWKEILKDVFNNYNADPTVASLLGFVSQLKSAVTINGKLYSHDEVMKVLTELVSPLAVAPIKPSGVNPSGLQDS